jgi:hypothetical protein
MLIDVRIYQTRPGTRELHLELFNEHGLKPQSRLLGKPFAYLKSIEDPNEFILMWAYDNLEDRDIKREKMWNDKEWNEYVKLSKDLNAVISQYNKLLET